MNNGPSTETRFADKLLQLALDAGADEAEVYVKLARNLSIDVKEHQIDTLERSDSIGYSVRVFKNGRLGFSYSTDPAEMIEIARRAIEASDFTEPDESNGLPIGNSSSEVSVYDDSISALNERDAIDMVLSMENAAIKQDKRITKTRNASGSFSIGRTRIINSKGIDFEFASSACSAHIMAVAELGLLRASPEGADGHRPRRGEPGLPAG